MIGLACPTKYLPATLSGDAWYSDDVLLHSGKYQYLSEFQGAFMFHLIRCDFYSDCSSHESREIRFVNHNDRYVDQLLDR